MHQCSASIHWREGREQRTMFMWRYWPHSFTWKRRGRRGSQTAEGNWVCSGSDCKMNHEFDFCVIQAFVIIYLGVWGCLCVCILIWVYYMCGFGFMSLQGYVSTCMCVSRQFESVWLMFACVFLFVFCPWLESQWGAMFSSVESRSDPTLPLPPALLPALLSSNNTVKSNTRSVIMWDMLV